MARATPILSVLCLLAAAPAVADTPIDCADFWQQGYPVDGSDEQFCYEYPVTGTTDRVFYHEDWAVPGGSTHIDNVMAAVRETRAAIEPLGDLRPIYVVFDYENLDIPDEREHPLPMGVSAHYAWPQLEEPCPLVVFPWGIEGWDPDDTRQLVAHEVFHCFQLDNFQQQMTGPDLHTNSWWTEGTATYFINAPYPTGDLEHVPQATYDPAVNLLEQSYATTGFFQSLVAAGGGRGGVLQLIEAMPTSGGRFEQQEALAAVPNIQQHLHKFGQQYLDSAIPDDGGGLIAIAPKDSPQRAIDASGNVEFTTPPFTLGHHTLSFGAGADYRISLRAINGEGRDSARRDEEGAPWEDLPDEITARCEDDADYRFLSTSAGEPGVDYRIVLVVEREIDPDCCHAANDLEPSLIGTWRADARDVITQVYPQEGGDKGVGGAITITIGENGHFVQRFEGITVTMVREYPNAPTTTFIDQTNGTVTGCLTTQAVGARGMLSINLSNRTANIKRTHSAPNGEGMPATTEHLGLAFGIPAGDSALGMIKPDGPNAFVNKKVRYERVAGPGSE